MTNYDKENTHTQVGTENKAFEQNKIQFLRKHKVNLGIIIKTDRVDPLFSHILYLRILLSTKISVWSPRSILVVLFWSFGDMHREAKYLTLQTHKFLADVLPSCFSSHTSCLFCVYLVPNFFSFFVFMLIILLFKRASNIMLRCCLVFFFTAKWLWYAFWKKISFR